jgi:hypothetical protein
MIFQFYAITLLITPVVAQISVPRPAWKIRRISVAEAQDKYRFHVLQPSNSSGLKLQDVSAVWAKSLAPSTSKVWAHDRVGIRLTYRRAATGGLVYIFQAKSQAGITPMGNVGRIVADAYFGSEINRLRERRDTGYTFDTKNGIDLLVVTSAQAKVNTTQLIKSLR